MGASSLPRLQLPIETPRLLIREFETGDLEDIHAYSSLEQVTQYVFWTTNSRDETAATLRSYIAAQEDRPRRTYELALVPKADDRVAGAVSVYLGDMALRRDAEVGFVLHPAFWGQGLAVEAAGAVMAAAFFQLRLHRIWATCDQRNVQSARVLEKLGMRREATFVESRRVGDAWQNECLYAVLGREFAA